MTRPARALCLLLLALATAATAARAARLAGGEVLTAHGERRWFGWAYRHPGVAAQLARARAGLAAGETVWLEVDAGPDRKRWLRVMARYHLPEQELGGMLEPGAAPPGEGTVVAVDLEDSGAAGAGGEGRLRSAGGGEAGSAREGGPRSRGGGAENAPAAIGEAGAGGRREAVAVALGAALAVAIGLAGLRPGSAANALAAAPLAGTAGLALLTAALYPPWRMGLPAGPFSVLGTGAVVAGALALVSRRAGGAGAAAPPERAGGRLRRTRLRAAAVWAPAAVALATFLWKLTLVPLWSWDHYAIWGFKARRMFPGGVLDVGWLVPSEFARPDYPLGLPLAWRALTLGAEPGPAAFATAHALMAIALVALVGRAASRLGGGALAGGAAAALAAVSPLLWDTESLGLADLPLALFAVAAVAAVAPRLAGAPAHGTVAAARRPGSAADGTAAAATAGAPAELPGEPAAGPPPWIAGVCVGFLPWLKSEGLPLALLLLAALAAALLAGPRQPAGAGAAPERRSASRRRSRDLLALALPALLLGAAGLAATPALGMREIGFFRGDWAGRAIARLGEAPRILRAMAADLLEPGWLGLWPLWALAVAALAVAVIRRRRAGRTAAAAGLALSAAVALQLGVYLATYLATHLPPEQHLETSFFRVAAALAPLALIAAVAAGRRAA